MSGVNFYRRFIWLGIVVITYVLGVGGYREPFLPASLVVLACLGYLYLYRKNLYLVVTLTFIVAYPLIYLSSLLFEIPYHYLLEYQVPNLEFTLFFWMLVFVLIVFDAPKKAKIDIPPVTPGSTNIALMLLGSATLVSLLGVVQAWPPILIGTYGVESRSSQLFEYSLILIVASLVFKTPDLKNSRAIKYNGFFLICMLICFVAPLLYGRRGPALMFFWLGLLVISSNYKIKISHLAIVGLLIVAVRVFALYRAGSDVSLISMFWGDLSNEAMSNHQGGVIVSSVTYLGLIEAGDWGWEERIRMLLGSGLAFIPYSIHPFPEAFIHRYVHDFSTIPGSGGFPFVYAFLWGADLMVLIIAYFLRSLIWSSGSSDRAVILKLLILAMLPRWYAYTLPVLIKFLVLGFFLGLAIDLLKRKVRVFDKRY
jgi:hypothetical protein